VARLRELDQRLRAYVDRLTPGLRREVEAALRKLQSRLSDDAILELLAGRGEFAIRQMTARLSVDLQGAVAVLSKVAAKSAQVAVAGLPQGVRASLNVTNPAAITASRQAARLVTNVSSETRSAIQQIVTRAFQEGIPPRQVQQLIRPLIGLTERQAKAVMRYRFETLVKRGLAPDKIATLADKYAAKLLKQRAELIARTEVIKASVDGQQAIWQQMQSQGVLPPQARQSWIVTFDDRLCSTCRPMDGRTAGIGGTFVTPRGTSTGPPLHPGCRCSISLATKSLSLTAPRRRVA